MVSDKILSRNRTSKNYFLKLLYNLGSAFDKGK